MSIYTQRAIKIANNKASMPSDIYIYRGNRNIELVFTITDHAFKFKTKDNSGNVIEAYSPSHGYVTLLAPQGLELCSGKASIVNDKLVFKIKADMIDETTEIGDYDIVIDLYDEDGDALLTLPPVNKQIHILERVSTVINPTEDPVTFNEITGELSVGENAVYSSNTNDMTLSQESIFDANTGNLSIINFNPKETQALIKSINDIRLSDTTAQASIEDIQTKLISKYDDINIDGNSLSLSSEGTVKKTLSLPTYKIPTKISELTNDIGYVAEIPTAYGDVSAVWPVGLPPLPEGLDKWILVKTANGGYRIFNVNTDYVENYYLYYPTSDHTDSRLYYLNYNWDIVQYRPNLGAGSWNNLGVFYGVTIVDDVFEYVLGNIPVIDKRQSEPYPTYGPKIPGTAIDISQLMGDTESIAAYVGKEGQLIVDRETKKLHLMDGVTPGGYVIGDANTKISFNEQGELVISIDGVTKTFTPKP